MTKNKTIRVFAPAKINLFLHLTGVQKNSYHKLQSLIGFADIGDYIEITSHDHFDFSINGPFAKAFGTNEHKASNTDNSNLVVKAARTLSQIEGTNLRIKINLEKNLPIASGLGGGSSDAAATIWGLQELWGLDRKAKYLLPLMAKLGADVPVCLNCRPCLVEGFGEELLPAPLMPEIPILIVNPLLPCPTAEIFKRNKIPFKKKIELPDGFLNIYELTSFLRTTSNDLHASAVSLLPEISNIINALETQDECLIARMSGSGASCFGLFETMEAAEKAAKIVLEENPDWWVKSGWLNSPERY